MSSMEESEIYYRVHRKPRMSAAMLGEYMAAEDDERETVARNAKFAKTARTVTYKRAREFLIGFITSDRRDLRILYDAIKSWKSEVGNPLSSADGKDELQACIEALESVVTNYNALGFATLSTSRTPYKQPKMIIEGVKVSAQLDAFLHATERSGEKKIGGIQFQLSKGRAEGKKDETKAKRDLAGTYASVLMLRHVQEHFVDLGSPRHDLCMLANVRKGRVWAAPENHKRMLNRIDAAARSIQASWNSIIPPADFDAAKARFVD